MMFDVGVIATHVYPALGYGGVSVTTARLTAAWAQNGSRRIGLCASNASEVAFITSKDVQLGVNVEVRLYRSYWFKRWGFGFGAIPAIFNLCRQSKTIYIHGIATWPSTLGALMCCLLRRSFVIAPRGGLMPEHVEHIRQHKLAKWIFYNVLTFPTLRRARAIHCTSDLEASALHKYINKDQSVVIFSNGISLEPVRETESYLEQSGITLCYLGRISHEKGINSFLRVWLKVRRAGDKFIVAGGAHGAGANAYFKEFLKLVSQSGGSIDYRGYVDATDVSKIIESSHFLVLPSGLEGDIRENFGNVVAESLAMSRPVIVCRGLAWDHLESMGAGFVFERNLDGADTVMQRVAAMSKDYWREMATRARNYAEGNLDINVVAECVWEILTESTSERFCSSTRNIEVR
jgi:glycosyltransferase involved in cell wall biosynthesis